MALVLAAMGAAALYLLSSVPLDLSAARSDIEARLTRLVGAPVVVDGTAEFSLFPKARVVLSSVRAVAGGSHPVQLDVDRLEAEFDLLDALTGTADIKRVTLVRPEIGPPSEIDPAGAAAIAPPPASPGIAPPSPAGGDRRDLRDLLVRFEGLRELRIRDGLLHWPGLRNGLSNANLDFRWDGGSAPALLEGTYVWNGQPATIRTRLDRPLPFFDGETSPIQVQLSSPSGEAAFSGEGSGGEYLRLAGALKLSTPSLSRAARWIDGAALPDFGAFSLETRIELVGDRLNLGALDLDLGGSRARGAVEAILTGGANAKRSVSGTLAFQDLDVSPFLQTVAPVPRNIVDLQRPIRIDWAKTLDIDMRVSAARARFGDIPASDVAAAVKVMNGSGILDIGDMSVLGGSGSMRVGLDMSGPQPALSADMRLRRVGMADLAALSQTPIPFSAGSGDLDLSWKGPAANWGEILMDSRSNLTLRVDNGTLQGFAPDMLRSAGQHAIDLSPGGASQPFQDFTLSVHGAGTRMRLDTVAMTTSAGTSEAHGTFDARTQAIELRGRSLAPVVEASGSGPTFTSSQPVSFTIRGDWPRPDMIVNAPDAPI
ncbi:AsmA-like C-terminal region-containing protein [Aureimonas sp. ME7]|uniref:AsmA family protein n=1 Tax=Aureimonas sp. ME7 TaxID=2744252 RepID=UPI0015F41412|nr:AsmA-like C-terminal region-containing protein [Aureimonas sp. ME7]